MNEQLDVAVAMLSLARNAFARGMLLSAKAYAHSAKRLANEVRRRRKLEVAYCRIMRK
jgi:hypothetical protein